jgi:alpha-methylacyl-CoA racemase
MSGPLAGIRVVELAGIGPTPHAAMLLADGGADVIRPVRPTAAGEAADVLDDTSVQTSMDPRLPSAFRRAAAFRRGVLHDRGYRWRRTGPAHNGGGGTGLVRVWSRRWVIGIWTGPARGWSGGVGAGGVCRCVSAVWVIRRS